MPKCEKKQKNDKKPNFAKSYIFFSLRTFFLSTLVIFLNFSEEFTLVTLFLILEKNISVQKVVKIDHIWPFRAHFGPILAQKVKTKKVVTNHPILDPFSQKK